MLAKYEIERLLTEEYDYKRPRRGQIRKGEVIKMEEGGVTIDLGLKRDGFVPRTDLDRLGDEVSSSLEPGQEVTARVVRLENDEGNLVLSIYQARFEEDWARARELLQSGDIWQGEVTDYNRGGLVVTFGHSSAFVPASHLFRQDMRRMSPDQRKAKLKAYVGQELPLKVIEVNRKRRRLIASERLARQETRDRNRERLLNELVEGQICSGTVSKLCDFGAFVDLGGAEGLIHISELAWRRIQHPREVLKVGDEIDVYVVRLDRQRKRIGLSLKRLQLDPWMLIDETYTVDQLVSGIVTNVVDFGVFVALDIGVEGLVHISELADPPPSDPRELVKRGDKLILRILRIDSIRQRIGLSLRQVPTSARDEFLSQTADGQAPGAGNSSSANDEEPVSPGNETGGATPYAAEPVEEDPCELSSSALDRQPQEDGLWLSLLKEEVVELD
jgi:small subunit ribosomal protein S1